MQLMLLEMLQERAPGAMHYALRNAGGARGVHDEQWMIKRQLHKRQGRRVCRQGIAIESCAANARHIRRLVQKRNDDHRIQAADRLADLLQLSETIAALAAVKIAIDGKQYLGFDLTKTVKHPVKTKIRRTG